MINFSDITYIKNFTTVGIINLKSSQFLNYHKSKSLFRGSGINPYLQNTEFEKSLISEFVIILSSNPKSQNVITYGNQICLMTRDFQFITCLNNGEIRLEGLKNDKLLLSSNIPPNSKFAIIDPTNQSNISRPLLFNDKIILRSNFGNFLMIGLELSVSCAGMIISEETTWRLTKTSYDQFPDWLTKRKYLNNNNISYLYNFERFLEQSNISSNSTNNNFGMNLNNMNMNFSNISKKTKNFTGSNREDKVSLMTLSYELQEKCLIEDLLLVMLGRDGVFIKRSHKKEIIPDKISSNNNVLNEFNSAINSLNNPTMQNNIFKNYTLKFEIEPYLDNPTCDSSLLYIVCKILPLSSYYDKIMNFINLSSNVETGIISKCFIIGVNEIIRDYIIFINQLEIEYFSDNLDIQRLWYLTQTSLKFLDNLQKICFQSTFTKGGALINTIYDVFQNNTDTELDKLYKFLLEKSVQKYMHIMKQWICKGMLIDNFQEFMVVMSHNYTRENLNDYYYDLFWEKKFVLNKTNTPIFLNEISEKILFIGKCLNILRECKIEFICPYENEFDKFLDEKYCKQTKDIFSKKNITKKNQIQFSNEQEEINKNSKNYLDHSTEETKKICIFESDILIEFSNLIDKVYDWANLTLKNVLYQECNIISVLKSIKKFYFMECGDFYNYLIDTLDDVLMLEKNTVDLKKIELNIDNALRSTSANLDQNKDLFKFNMSDMIVRTEKIYLEKYTNILETQDITDLMMKISQLNEDQYFFEFKDCKVMESLILEISVKWPLNLMFSRKTLMKYKILFRQLLLLKYEEKKLSEIWILQQNFKNIKLQNYLKPSYLLRDRMINFIKNIIYYFFNEVIEPNYILFLDDLSYSKSIDEIIFNHEKFLDNCLKECLLDDSDILMLLNDIINTCLVYSKVIIKYYNSFISDLKLNCNFELEKSKGMNYSARKKAQIERETEIFESIFVGEKFFEAVEKFSSSFENRLESLMDRINRLNTKSNPHFVSLLTKLDYNNYYSDRFAKNK